MRIRQYFVDHFPTMIKFSVAGTISSVFYYGLFVFLWQWKAWSYQGAITVAFVFSSLIHFFCCRRYAFKSHQHALGWQATKYLMMLATNYAITIGIVELLSGALAISPYISVVVSISVNVVLGYLLANYWVFKSQRYYC